MKALHPQTLEFLQGIDDFNEKKFFDLYKPLYLNIKERFEFFVEELIKEISKFDKILEGLDAKKCIFRIYKDCRRPANRERPYKINMGASITTGGRKSKYAGYYLHIQNGQSFFCGGLRRPKATEAYAIREHIYNEREVFNKIIKKRKLKQTFGTIHSSQAPLKKANRKSRYSKILGTIPDTHPSLKYIEMKDWLLYKKIEDKDILSEDFFKQSIDYAKTSFAFTNFINEVI